METFKGRKFKKGNAHWVLGLGLIVTFNNGSLMASTYCFVPSMEFIMVVMPKLQASRTLL
jgi:hypothetical protein